NQKEPHHHDAVHREHAVVDLRLQQRAVGVHEMQPDQSGGGPADEKEERDRGEEQDRDALVVAREEPRAERVLVAEVALGLALGVSCGQAGRRGAHGDRPSESDLMYASMRTRSSSLSWPSKEGMTGGYPATR